MMNMNYYSENTFYALKECIKLMECLKHIDEDNSEMEKQNTKRLYETCKKLKNLREKIW